VTIRKGEAWGVAAPLPADGVVVRSDAEASAIVATARTAGHPVPAIGLLGGDLCRSLGGRGDAQRLRSADAMTFRCDLGVVSLDGEEHVFVAHAAAHRGWWRGRALVVMNAAWLGRWNLGPKAHPGDGLLDVSVASVPRGQRRAVERRLRLGAHLPHPSIRATRVPAGEWDLGRATPVYLDGVRVGHARHVVARVEPDALTVVV